MKGDYYEVEIRDIGSHFSNFLKRTLCLIIMDYSTQFCRHIFPMCKYI